MAPDKTARLICPRCESSMRIDCEEFQGADGQVQIRHACACGHAYLLFLERRREPRKPARMFGVWARASGGPKRSMIVRDISRRGIRFESEIRVPLSPDEPIIVAFYLNNGQRVPVRKKLRVRGADGAMVRGEFIPMGPMATETERACDRAIAHFLLSDEGNEGR